MTRVPLLDLTRSNPDTDVALRAAFERVLGSGQFVMGPDVGEIDYGMSVYVCVCVCIYICIFLLPPITHSSHTHTHA